MLKKNKEETKLWAEKKKNISKLLSLLQHQSHI